MVPAVYLGRHISTKTQLINVDVRVGVDIRVSIIVGKQWGLRLRLRFGLGFWLS